MQHPPRQKSKLSYDKGRCVPVGWKPLVVDPRVRSYIYARAKRTCLEARDREAQRRAAEEKQREREKMRERVDEDLEACEAELERVKARRDELAAEKHECFTKLKACLQRESLQKKADDERKRREVITLQQQPLLAAAIQAQAQAQAQAAQAQAAQAQTSNLISNQHLLTQQNLLTHHFSTQNILSQQALLQHQQLLAAQKYQELAQQAQQRGLVQQPAIPTAPQNLPAGINAAYLQQALGQVQGLLPTATPAVPGFNAAASVTRGTPPIANPLVFNQFAVDPKPQPATTQAAQLKVETASPQVSPAPQALGQQPYGLQQLPASFLSNSNPLFTRAFANYRQDFAKHLGDSNPG
ncbi:unnamed protein product [Cylicocyclus nassatus]|uniref:Uncharacterized protein n=1 Tax=Cylicocyclus nassatus TaxID=53992 RepID=A0AA36M9T6_CYLNA|nr:unnamed protein product [Cylicocyclus nassatus]